MVYNTQARTQLRDYDEGLRQARKANKMALELDPDFAWAHAQRGYQAMMFDRDFEAAAKHLQLARILAPKDTKVLGVSAVFAETLGRLDEAIELGKQALTLNPLDPILYLNLATNYSYTGQLDMAEAMFRKSIELGYKSVYTLTWLAKLHLLQGRPDEALAVAEQIDLEQREFHVSSMAYHDLGQAVLSQAALSALKEGYADSAAAFIAEVHAWRGEADASFEWLDRAIEESQYMWGSLSFDPAFNNLHDDPRWQVFRARVGRSEEQLKKIEF